MSIYALWNNKGGVGKSYLTFQIAAEYARTHSKESILVIDLCPQANSSSMLLGGMVQGEAALDQFGGANPRRTIAGYIRERITSPYVNPMVGANYLTQVQSSNSRVPPNLYLVVGDGELEILGSRVFGATRPGPTDAWIIVHRWITDLINDARQRWNVDDLAVFIDCNPSFSIYTELALAAAERLIIPFSADGSSRRAVRTVLNLLYGDIRNHGAERSEFARNMEAGRMQLPEIYLDIRRFLGWSGGKIGPVFQGFHHLC